MYDRFTRTSRVTRGSIPKTIRTQVFARDGNRCVFCGATPADEDRTIDHLIPLALGGLDEVVNYVTACRPCNEKKGSMPLAQFAADLRLPIPAIPVHGDPVLDNQAIPASIRAIRASIHHKMREGELKITGRRAQQKIEKEYRRALWASDEGKRIEAQAPSLPGHARVMLPEIETIAQSEEERLLLIELAKSASTRNLIGSVLKSGGGLVSRVEALARSTSDCGLARRLDQALKRFRRVKDE